MSGIAEKSVWALIEQQDGKLGDGALELMGEVARLAEKLKTEPVAVTTGSLPPDQVALLTQQGAKTIIFIEHPSVVSASIEANASLFAGVIQKHQPAIVLVIHSIYGADLAARIATTLNIGLVTACDRVDTDPEGLLNDTKPVYGGKAAAMCVTLTRQPQMATINPDALDMKTRNPKNTSTIVPITPSVEPPGVKVRKVGFTRGDPRSMPLTEAEIVVCAGMGIMIKENLRLVQELADIIGGSVGATRRVVDEGWIGLSRQIGLTGKTVHPKLYIACGVSGAIQHTMGMKDSRAIIAINTDRNAPIFKIADVSILGDVNKIMPVLTAHLKKTLSQIPKPVIGDVLNAAAGIKAK